MCQYLGPYQWHDGTPKEEERAAGCDEVVTIAHAVERRGSSEGSIVMTFV